MWFFIVGNRYGGETWEMLYTRPFDTFEAAQEMAARIPRPWNPTIVSTTKESKHEKA
jgi:hypothetical protein